VRERNVLGASLIALILTTALLAAMVTPGTSTRIYVEPTPVLGVFPNATDPTFTVDVKVDANNLYGWEFTLDFNPWILEVVNVTRGAFLGTAGLTAWENGTMAPVINNPAGYAAVGDILLDLSGAGASGLAGVLATIEFRVVGWGVCVLDLKDTGLYTIVSGIPKPMDHAVQDGYFDNRLATSPPFAFFTCPPVGAVNVPVTCDASASHDNADGGWIVSYEWDFGDGTTASGKVVTHEYNITGSYTVTLTVTDNDGLTDTATDDIDIGLWIDIGWFPDLVEKCAWPEKPWLREWYGERELELWARVANPTETDYEVKVVYEVFSKDEVKLLGTLETDVELIPGGTTGKASVRELSVTFDTRDSRWRCKSGGGDWVYYVGWIYPFKKYISFARCYYREPGTSEWQEAYVNKYLHWNVYPWKHDIGIVDMQVVPDVIESGSTANVILNVTNIGRMEETFDVTAYCDDLEPPEIGVETLTLAPGDSQIVTFQWDTTGVSPGTYIIKAKLPVLTYEKPAYTGNNNALVVVYVV